MMSAVSRIESKKRLRAASLRGLIAVVFISAFAAALARDARAQVTAESLTSSAVGDVDKFGADVDDAIRRFEKGDIDGTRSLLEMARKKQPKLAPVDVMLAQLFLAANKPALARTELEHALRESPNDPEAYIVLADFALQEGRISEASMMYAKALPILEAFNENPKRKKAFIIRYFSGAAGAAEARDDWAKAGENLTKLVAADPDLVPAHLRLARALFKASNARESYEELKAAAKIEPKVIAPEVILASYYRQAKDTANADKWIGVASKLSPGNFSTLVALAKWKLEGNHCAEAVTYCDAALKLEPDNTESLLLRAVLARMLNDNAMAQKLLERVHMESPLNGVAINQLALVLADSNEKDKAKEDGLLRRALQFAELNAKLNPKNADALATLGWTCYRSGHKAEAQKYLGAALSAGQLSPDSAYFVAILLKEMGRNAEALKLVNVALESEAPFAYHDEAAALQTRLIRRNDGRPERAERDADSAPVKPASTSGSK